MWSSNYFKSVEDAKFETSTEWFIMHISVMLHVLIHGVNCCMFGMLWLNIIVLSMIVHHRIIISWYIIILWHKAYRRRTYHKVQDTTDEYAKGRNSNPMIWCWFEIVNSFEASISSSSILDQLPESMHVSRLPIM